MYVSTCVCMYAYIPYHTIHKHKLLMLLTQQVQSWLYTHESSSRLSNRKARQRFLRSHTSSPSVCELLFRQTLIWKRGLWSWHFKMKFHFSWFGGLFFDSYYINTFTTKKQFALHYNMCIVPKSFITHKLT